MLRNTYQLRYAMQPYLYTEARRTYDTGVAFFRPLYYDWPEDDAAYTSKNEYMFGDEMIAAPVVAPADKISGLATEKIWLPEGDWIEWPTGKHFDGPATVERSFSIDQIPVYVRAGAIVPMQPAMLLHRQKPVDPLIVNVWPLAPGQSSSYSVYEDSGDVGRISARRFCAHADSRRANGRHAPRGDWAGGRQLSRHAEDAQLRTAPARRLAACSVDGER